MNEQAPGDWNTTDLKAGQPHEFKWFFTAGHPTRYFHYFITKNGWDQTQKLTRDSFRPLCEDNRGTGGATTSEVSKSTHSSARPIPSAVRPSKHALLACGKDDNTQQYLCY